MKIGNIQRTWLRRSVLVTVGPALLLFAMLCGFGESICVAARDIKAGFKEDLAEIWVAVKACWRGRE